VDISEAMVTLAKEASSGRNIQIKKVDGVALPFATDSFDVALTSTVLQHNTDAQMAERLIAEMCRVTKGDIYIFERIERTIKGTELCVGRPVAYYQSLFSKHQFALVETRFLNIHVSYFVAGVIRKLCNGRTKKEGAPTVHYAAFSKQHAAANGAPRPACAAAAGTGPAAFYKTGIRAVIHDVLGLCGSFQQPCFCLIGCPVKRNIFKMPLHKAPGYIVVKRQP
jgi:SAM-dependent methyltransferase